MSTVELLGVVLQVVLAAAGVIISVIEVLRVKKDREEQKKKREIFLPLLSEGNITGTHLKKWR